MGFSDHPLTQSWRSRQRSNLLAACCAWHEVADAVSAIVGRGRKRTISYCTHLQRTRRWRPRVNWHDGEIALCPAMAFQRAPHQHSLTACRFPAASLYTNRGTLRRTEERREGKEGIITHKY